MRYSVMVFILCVLWSAICWANKFVPEVKKPVQQAIDIQKRLQEKKDRWMQERQRLLQQCKRISEEIKILEYQNQDLKKEEEGLKTSIDALREEIKRAGEISTGIMPLLWEIYHRMEKFVKLDMPFLRQERKVRLARLKELLEDPSASLSEKYRRTMEALFVEVRYGESVGVYQDRIDLSGRKVMGTVFRLGRIALFFKSPDGMSYAFFDPGKRVWQPLSPSQGRDIARAIEIARKRRPASVLMLPIGRMESER